MLRAVDLIPFDDDLLEAAHPPAGTEGADRLALLPGADVPVAPAGARVLAQLEAPGGVDHRRSVLDVHGPPTSWLP